MADDAGVRDGAEVVPAGGDEVSVGPESKMAKNATYLFDLNVVGYPLKVFSVPFMNGGTAGIWVNEAHELHLLETLNGPEQEADVLLHEAIHAISDVAMAPDDRLTERQVNTLSTVLCDSVRRSPSFRDYLLARLLPPDQPGDEQDD
jgi:hypothetical protein